MHCKTRMQLLKATQTFYSKIIDFAHTETQVLTETFIAENGVIQD